MTERYIWEVLATKLRKALYYSRTKEKVVSHADLSLFVLEEANLDMPSKYLYTISYYFLFRPRKRSSCC